MSKILHRIFFNFNDGPDPFKTCLETWKKELPDFEIKLWNKNNLPLDLNEYTRIMSAEKNHAFLSDFFRCWLLEKHGGVYLDADIEVLNGNVFRRLYEEAQTAHDYDLLIGIESAGNGKLTAHSMAVKDGTCHPILTSMMNLYQTAFSGPLHHMIKQFNMPSLMSLFFLDLEKEGILTGSMNGVFSGLKQPLISHGMKIYPQEYFSPLTTRDTRMMVSAFTENTALCHHFAATWHPGNDKEKKAKLFSEGLKDGDYYIDPDLLPVLRKTYQGFNIKAKKPLWRLTDSTIKHIESLLNTVIPYKSLLYRMLKSSR